MRTAVRLSPIAVLLSAALLAGCGGTVLDDVKTEDAVQANLEESFERQIDAVDCPSDQEVEAGATFECSVRFSDGEEATATLRIKNEDADVDLIGLKANE